MMSVFLWLSFFIICLIGWNLFRQGLAELSSRLKRRRIFQWGPTIVPNMGRAGILTLFEGSPMRSMESTERELKHSGDRIFLLRLALADLSLFWLWIVLFVFFGVIPATWFLFAGGIVYIAHKWASKKWERRFFALGLLLMGLGLVLVGMDVLLQHSAKFLADTAEPPMFIYALATGHWWGALLGLFCGVILEVSFLIPGISWMASVALILSGVSSLGTAWGFLLALPLVASLRTLRSIRESSRRQRAWMMLAFSLLGFLVTPYLELASQIILRGDYMPQLRWQQLNVMVILWMGIETVFALTYFHFKYGNQKQKPTMTTATAAAATKV
jgi:hypothetical protein